MTADIYAHMIKSSDREAANAVINQFDVRAFKFTTLATFKKFQKQIKLIKPDK